MEEKSCFNYKVLIVVLLIFALIIGGVILGSRIGSDKNDNLDGSNVNNSSVNNKETSIKKSDIIIDDELKNKIVSVIEKYNNEIFMNHSFNYCGDLDMEDSYSDNFKKNKSFKSISEIKSYFSSIVSDIYFNNNLSDKFVEYNGGLYCFVPGRGSLVYESGSLNVTNIVADGENLSVQGTYKTLEDDMNPGASFNFSASMVMINGNWVIDSIDDVK